MEKYKIKEIQAGNIFKAIFYLLQYLKKNPGTKIVTMGRGRTKCRGYYWFVQVQLPAQEI